VRIVLVLGGLAMAAASAFGQVDGRLLVAVKGEQRLAIVDPGTGKVVGSISEQPVPGKDTGHEVTASADGKLAYVPIYGDSGVGKPGSDGREMEVMDLAAGKLVERVDFGKNYAGAAVRPHLPVLGPPVPGHPDGLLYVTAELKQAVTVIDPKTMTVIGEIPTGSRESHMFAVSHDGKRGYTANVGPGTVSVLDLDGKAGTKNPVAVIPVSGNIQRISVSKDDRWVFTSDQTKPELDVIDAKTLTVAKRIPIDGTGYGTAVTPDGKWLLVPMESKDEIAVIDLKTMTVARNVTLAKGSHPQEALARPDGKVAYVSCDFAGQVAEIDLGTWAVTRMIAIGKAADGLAWAR
jgi:DNA-binding beta-propeller fold protein YncE